MLTNDVDKGKVFFKRISVLFGVELFLILMLVLRLYYLQVVESHKYKMMADENRMSMRLIAPQRGIIVDRFGHPLALNVQNFRALLISEQAGKYLDSTLNDFSKIIPLSEGELERIKKEIKRKRSFMPVTVKENISWEDMARIQMNLPDLPGIIIDEGLSRYYPYQSVTHAVGYVGPVNDADIASDEDPLLDLPGFRVGKMGIEEYFEKELRGVAGSRRVEVNAVGRVIREISRVESKMGEKITLTIDLRLQEYISRLFKRDVGAAVVMDVKTGEVLAMVSEPTFDANLFNLGLSKDDWEAIRNSPFAPMTNKAISGVYPPGSTFKMVVALAALESKAVTKDDIIHCKGFIDFKGHRVNCWKRGGHGDVNMFKAIKESCDTYFYEVALKTGIDKISEMAFKFGLGEKTGITLTNEKEGIIPTREWKIVNEGRSWQTGDTINVGIGQGSVLSTPLQLALMTARIANYGIPISPTIIKKEGSEENEKLKPIEVSQSNLQLIRDAMVAVVNDHNGGTAFTSRLSIPNIKMAGKTGTSQVRRIKDRRLKLHEITYKERDHALFVAYAPINNPKYTVAVIVEHGGGGSSSAAPIAKAIMEKTISLDPTNPNQTSILQ